MREFLTVIALLLLGGCANMGESVCEAKHPIEDWTTDRVRTCERQHVLQRQKGGEDDYNVIYINTVEHDYTDRTGKFAPWKVSEDKWLEFWGDENLRQAYKMGTYATGFHFKLYHNRAKEDIGFLWGMFTGNLTWVKWDGVSHIVYGVGSVFNFITKEASYIGYQFERLLDGKDTQFVDAILGIFIDLIEVCLGVVYSMFGVIIGTIINPWDTFTNLLGGVVLTVQTMVVGVWNTIADIISLFTLGFVEWQTARVFPEWGY